MLYSLCGTIRKRKSLEKHGDVIMAFDGITTACLVRELSDVLTGGGINRVVQNEKDELLLTIKNRRETYRLLLSAKAQLPLVYLTAQNRQAPLAAPNFCMLLRKHLQGGQITAVTQPSLERVIVMSVLHRDELGDLCEKRLVIELMGKYSNIILTDDKDTILDAIKRIPSSVSSVREVLPGRPWFIPDKDQKKNPLTETAGGFSETLHASLANVSSAILKGYTGISPLMAEDLCARANVDPRIPASELEGAGLAALTDAFLAMTKAVREGAFSPVIAYEGDVPCEYACLPILGFSGKKLRPFGSVSELLESFYGEKEAATRIKQKSADLRRTTATALERTSKKLLLQEKQYADTKKRDKYRLYGELLLTYGYEAAPGAKELTVTNYYDGTELTIPLDAQLTAAENSKKYFDRYGKLKRTAEALEKQLEESRSDRDQLASCLAAIDMAETEADLVDIRRELEEYGFVRRQTQKKGKVREAKSKPLVYLSSDGFRMYVGRNNYQNDEVSFKIGASGDWWFHAKNAPGSHVIVKTGGQELPDRAFEEAASLAAYYSSQRSAPKVEIDYTKRSNLRKTNGGKPGFVIYHTNYSLMATPDIRSLRRLEE